MHYENAQADSSRPIINRISVRNCSAYHLLCTVFLKPMKSDAVKLINLKQMLMLHKLNMWRKEGHNIGNSWFALVCFEFQFCRNYDGEYLLKKYVTCFWIRLQMIVKLRLRSATFVIGLFIRILLQSLYMLESYTSDQESVKARAHRSNPRLISSHFLSKLCSVIYFLLSPLT